MGGFLLIVSRSDFKYNKKRRHYAYLFKDLGVLRKNLLLHSDPLKKKNWSKAQQSDFLKRHTKLFKHPNPNKGDSGIYYVENRIYIDEEKCFDKRIYKWSWNVNDKRKIKRLKKGRRTR